MFGENLIQLLKYFLTNSMLRFYIKTICKKSTFQIIFTPPERPFEDLISIVSDGSPEPLTIDFLTLTPFPVIINEGATATLEAQLTLKEELPVGATVDLKLKLEGIIPIPIPCLELNGLHIGSW